MAFGAILEGKLENVKPEGYGFALCNNARGEGKRLFIWLGDTDEWPVGTQVEFTVSENKKGFAGVNPRVKG